MSGFEEKLDLVESALARAAQVQEQGQARLREALQRVEELVPAAGEKVVEAMREPAAEAALTHRDALLKVVEQLAQQSRGAVEEAAQTILELRKGFQDEIQASQGVLKGVNAEAERASGLLQRLGDQGSQGSEALKAIQEDLRSLREGVAGYQVELKDAIKQAEKDAREEMGTLRERIQGMLPGYVAWFREGFNAVVVLLGLNLAFWGAYYAAKAYVEKNKGDEIWAKVVNQAVPVGRVYTVSQITTSKGERQTVVDGRDLSVPLLDIGDGFYTPMKPDGKGGWTSYKYPNLTFTDLEPARVYRDKSRKRKLGE